MKHFCLALILTCALAAPVCASGATRLTVGVTPFPHKDIMLVVKKLLAKEGIALVIQEFNDYVQPNMALEDKALDANFFQHIPYLENMAAEKNLHLAWIVKVHIEPLGLYSGKIKKLDELSKGDVVAVPNDPTNEARALRLLEAHGLVKIRPGELATVRDITDNPKDIKFVELEAAQLPRMLQDVKAAVINANFAGVVNLEPARDAIVREGGDSPYANVIAVRAADVDSPAIKALARAANSPEVKAYIERELLPKGIIPAF